MRIVEASAEIYLAIVLFVVSFVRVVAFGLDD